MGSSIALARHLTGYTRAELARAAGLSEQTLLRIEMGALDPTPAILTSISRVLGVKVVAMTSPDDADVVGLLADPNVEYA